MIKTRAYVSYDDEEAGTAQGISQERTRFEIEDVCRYQECRHPETAGTAVWLRDGGRLTVAMPFDEFERRYEAHEKQPLQDIFRP